MEFIGSTFTLNAGAGFTGAGLPRVAGGTLTVAANAAAVDLTLDSGTINGGANLTVTDTLVWTSGNMSDTGLTIIPMGAALNLSGSATKNLLRSINNASGSSSVALRMKTPPGWSVTPASVEAASVAWIWSCSSWR